MLRRQRVCIALVAVAVVGCMPDGESASADAPTVWFEDGVPAEAFLAVLDSLAEGYPVSEYGRVRVLDPAYGADRRRCQERDCFAADVEIPLPAPVRERVRQRPDAELARVEDGFCDGRLHVAFVSARQLPSGRYLIEAVVADLRSRNWTFRELDLYAVACRGAHCRTVGGIAGHEPDIELRHHPC